MLGEAGRESTITGAGTHGPGLYPDPAILKCAVVRSDTDIELALAVVKRRDTAKSIAADDLVTTLMKLFGPHRHNMHHLHSQG